MPQPTPDFLAKVPGLDRELAACRLLQNAQVCADQMISTADDPHASRVWAQQTVSKLKAVIEILRPITI